MLIFVAALFQCRSCPGVSAALFRSCHRKIVSHFPAGIQLSRSMKGRTNQHDLYMRPQFVLSLTRPRVEFFYKHSTRMRKRQHQNYVKMFEIDCIC